MGNSEKKQTCILTFDIEEWFQVENLKGAIRKSDWRLKKSSVEGNTFKILELLNKYGISATFFILGWIAEEKSGLVSAISAAGHEIACHGFSHDLAYSLNEEILYQDILRSKMALESITSQKVIGYRAPSFSISDTVLKILRDLKFIYDSSYNPFRWNERYGIITSKLQPVNHSCYLTEYGLLEIPSSTFSLSKFNLPMGGGAYFRSIPLPIFKVMVRAILKSKKFYTFYLHPWELEPGQEKIQHIKINYKFRHYYGLKKTEVKFEKFIQFLKESDCRFLKMEQFTNDLLEKLKK